MPTRVALLAQEDSRLPATSDTLGSLTRVVHELSLRLARRYAVTVYSARHETADPPEEERGTIRYVRFFPEPDRTLLPTWLRWRNRGGSTSRVNGARRWRRSAPGSASADRSSSSSVDCPPRRAPICSSRRSAECALGIPTRAA